MYQIKKNSKLVQSNFTTDKCLFGHFKCDRCFYGECCEASPKCHKTYVKKAGGNFSYHGRSGLVAR